MVQLNLSSEDELLLYCSRLNINEDINLKVKEILDKALDWNYIVDCSAKQGITPLFYWNLKKINNSKNVPSEVMKNLEKIYYSNLARNMLLYDELGKTLQAFQKAGIDTIVLKGAFLAEEIYKNIGLRFMGDIDLLIKQKDLQKVKIELTKLMYSATYIFPTKLHEQIQMSWIEELSFIHPDKKIVIDIHWDIQPLQSHYKIDINKFWNNAKPVKIAGIETLTFTPEDLLQHLCIHVDKHINFSGVPPAKPLRDYCDIAEVTRHYKDVINWDYFVQNSKDFELPEPIFQGLSIAKNYFGAFIPENVFSELKLVDPYINFADILKGVIKEDQSSTTNYLIYLKKVKGTWNKSLFVLGDLFPSKEYMVHRYSIKKERQVYMYYLFRSGTAFRWGLAVLWKLPHFFFKSTQGRH